MNTGKNYALLVARVLLSSVFIWEGTLQLTDPLASVLAFDL